MTRPVVFIAVLGSLIVSAYFCNRPAAVSTPSGTPTPTPSGLIEQLQFDIPQTQERLTTLDRCVQEVAQPGWQHQPYEIIGSFFEARWCSDSSACKLEIEQASATEQHSITLSTYHYTNQFPNVHGLGINAVFIPANSGWGARFYFSESGAGLVAEQFSLQFHRYDAPSTPPSAEVFLGNGYAYQVDETYLAISANLPLRDELALYLESAEAMQQKGLAKLSELAAKVEVTIRSHKVEHCDYGTPTPPDVPPPCNPRPLTPAEEQAALSEAQKHFAEQKQLLTDNYREMYAALLRAFPLDRCWAK